MSIYTFAGQATCACNYAFAESKDLDQHAHVHMLINAFAIPFAIMI